jgi:hypothetical protein
MRSKLVWMAGLLTTSRSQAASVRRDRGGAPLALPAISGMNLMVGTNQDDRLHAFVLE